MNKMSKLMLVAVAVFAMSSVSAAPNATWEAVKAAPATFWNWTFNLGQKIQEYQLKADAENIFYAQKDNARAEADLSRLEKGISWTGTVVGRGGLIVVPATVVVSGVAATVAIVKAVKNKNKVQEEVVNAEDVIAELEVEDQN